MNDPEPFRRPCPTSRTASRPPSPHTLNGRRPPIPARSSTARAARVPPATASPPDTPSNYRPDILADHIYFTALKGRCGPRRRNRRHAHGTAQRPRVPGRADRRLRGRSQRHGQEVPGNPTRSYRSTSPLLIVEEVHDWTRLSDEQRADWRERLTAMAASNAEILN